MTSRGQNHQDDVAQQYSNFLHWNDEKIKFYLSLLIFKVCLTEIEFSVEFAIQKLPKVGFYLNNPSLKKPSNTFSSYYRALSIEWSYKCAKRKMVSPSKILWLLSTSNRKERFDSIESSKSDRKLSTNIENNWSFESKLCWYHLRVW